MPSDYVMNKSQQRRKRNFGLRHQEFLKLAIKSFQEKGIEGITLTELAARSEYSKGTWYNHFSSSAEVIASLAVCNARLLTRYCGEIAASQQEMLSNKLTSVFFDHVNHAIVNQEIWTCGVLAKTWRGNETDRSLWEDLEVAEKETAVIVLDLCRETGSQLREDELNRNLDTVRAAVAGLCVLNVVRPVYTWAKTVSQEQSIGLVLAAIREAGLEPAPEGTVSTLWQQSRDRVERLSAEWRSEKANPAP